MLQKNVLLTALFLSMLLLASCNDEPREYNSIYGPWTCEEFDRTGTRRFAVEIDSYKDGIIISGLYNTAINELIMGKVVNEKITLNPNQPIGFTNTILRSGSGTVAPNFRSITLRYQVSDNSQIIDVTANLTR